MSYLRSDYAEQRNPLFRAFSEQQLEELHLASLEIMARTGCRIYDEEAITLLKNGGAKVTDGNLVRIQPALVEWALRAAPHRVVLCNREGNRVMPLETTKVFFGPGSDCLNTIDPRTGQRRKAKLQDIVDGMKVADALPNTDFVMSMFLPWDVPTEVSDRYQMEAMLLHTSKPIVYVTHDLSGCVDAVNMAAAVAGGIDELQVNPMAACYINVATSLRHNKEAVQKLLYLAELGLPFIYWPSAIRGLAAPITQAGAFALSNACQLTGLVMAQLKREGTPVIRGGLAATLDMRTTVMPYNTPENSQGGVASSALAHYYRLPVFDIAGCTDSKVLDQQATAEAVQSLAVAVLVGANLVHDVGYMESGLTYSLELLMMCDDAIGWLKRFMGGVEISEATLALDLIDEIGPDGDYLGTDHTLQHYKEDWYPRFYDRANYDDWSAAGGLDLREKVNKRVLKILESPAKLAVGEEMAEKVRSIRRAAEEKIMG